MQSALQRYGVSLIQAWFNRVRDKHGNLAVMELELIEPALWLRNHSPAATAFAEAIANIVLA